MWSALRETRVDRRRRRSFLFQYKWLKLESPRRPRSKIDRTPTNTAGQNRTAYIHSKTPGDPTKLQRSKSTGSVSTEPRNDGIPWRAAARASRLPYGISRESRADVSTHSWMFSSGFPPNLPTRAFHSSEESIYGAANGGGSGGADFLQVPLRDNSNVSETNISIRIETDWFRRFGYKNWKRSYARNVKRRNNSRSNFNR